MLYKVAIADDEDIMREGLANLVDWEAMGFELVAQFEDGKEALQYIKDYPVDIVFTDIKMTVVSGLELARYVHENKLPIKVVLVSGYKDFEYARQAVRFNVVDYIIKPISIKEIKEIFRKIKSELDECRKSREKELENGEKYLEMISVLKEQFINDLVLGAFRSREEIEKRVGLLGLNIDVGKSRCGLVQIHVENYRPLLNERWKYGEEGIHTAIQNLILSEDSSLFYYMFYKEAGSLQVLAVDSVESGENEFRNKLNGNMNRCKENIKEVLEAEVSVEIGDIYDNLHSFATAASSRSRWFASERSGSGKGEKKEYLNRALDKQKLLMSHMNDGDFETVKAIFEGLAEELKAVDIGFARSFTANLFELILDKLKENEEIIYTAVTSLFSYEDIHKLINVEDIKQFGLTMLEKMTGLLGKNAALTQGNVVARAKQYIQREYFKDITLNEVANYVFLNPAYLSRLFKEQTGENFVDYLIQVRMKAAGELLKNPGFKVYEVGSMIGYSSTKYFFRIFKKVYGCTPNEYRQKNMMRGGE